MQRLRDLIRDTADVAMRVDNLIDAKDPQLETHAGEVLRDAAGTLRAAMMLLREAKKVMTVDETYVNWSESKPMDAS